MLTSPVFPILTAHFGEEQYANYRLSEKIYRLSEKAHLKEEIGIIAIVQRR